VYQTAAGSDHTGISEPTRRVFFALWPDAQVRATFVHATHKAVRASGGRPVPADNIHSTLLFLGSVVDSRMAELVGVARDAASSADVVAASGRRPLEFVFDRIELWARSHVLVATTSMSGTAAHVLAAALCRVLQRETSCLGFACDPKPFRAHVTLARKVGRVSRTLHMHPVRWNLTGFALVESRTAPEGSQYSVLAEFPFRAS
jgi:2'-5' RNA ligase